MSIRHKNWAAGDQLKAADMNTVANNGVVQVDTIAELTDVFDNQLGVNVVFCLEDMKLYTRGDTEFDIAGVGGGWATFDEDNSTNVTFATQTDSETGVDYRVGTWLTSGTLELSEPGFVEAFLVGGGGGGHSDQNPAPKNAGGGAGYLKGMISLNNTSNLVKVGNGGGGNSSGGSPGVSSWIDTYMAAGGRGGGGTNNCQSGNWNSGATNSGATGVNGGGAGSAATAAQSGDGVWNDWDGSGRWYGGGGAAGRGDGDKPSSPSPNGGTAFRQSGAANSGAGAGSSAPPANGGSGIVIVRVEI